MTPVRLSSRIYAFYERTARWLSHPDYSRRISYTLMILACLAGVATYLVFAKSEVLGLGPRDVIILLNIDLILLLTFTMLVTARLVRLWVERRRGRAGSKLHVNLVLLLGLLTVTPAIVVTILSGIFFNVGVNGWFSNRVQTALQESTAVAEAYLAEHQKVIAESASSMAHILSYDMDHLSQDPTLFNHALDVHTEMRSLSEAVVFDSTQILARSKLSFSLQFESISEKILDQASRSVVILSSSSGDRVRALIQIPQRQSYLLVGRFIDPKVSTRIAKVQKAVGDYDALESKLEKLGVIFLQIFLITCLLLLLVAVWIGLSFATRLSRPIRSLIEASHKVAEGHWSVKVSESVTDDDLGVLSRAFNEMTSQLQGQKQALIKANRQLDGRRQFIEDVLGGVSSGVISLTSQGKVKLFNRSAEKILGLQKKRGPGFMIKTVHPEFQKILETFAQQKASSFQSQVMFDHNDLHRTLLVRLARGGEKDYILTFDDITGLVNAQKKAAWSDVARRIAHEIKNPLTPIQLSAERLRRKYFDHITQEQDREHFATCIATIIRQVEHIGKLVNEFSSFARMPSPTMAEEDLVRLAKESLFLHKAAYPKILFEFTCPFEQVILLCDASQMGQVLTNLILNAAQALQDTPPKRGKSVVKMSFTSLEGALKISVEDNGPGFPEENRELLTEPYVTNKHKGTGLGLAIVKKIVEDHGGTLGLGEAPGGGGRVQIVLPKTLVKALKMRTDDKSGDRVENGL